MYTLILLSSISADPNPKYIVNDRCKQQIVVTDKTLTATPSVSYTPYYQQSVSGGCPNGVCSAQSTNQTVERRGLFGRRK